MGRIVQSCKYLRVVSRLNGTAEETADSSAGPRAADADVANSPVDATLLSPGLAVVEHLARSAQVQSITERIAPLAVTEGPVRLAVVGCSPGDGASSVAAAIAADLGGRLKVATLLVDANLLRPGLGRIFDHSLGPVLEPMNLDNAAWQARSSQSGIACLSFRGAERNLARAVDDFRKVASSFAATLIDLGVVRLDARMLCLVEPKEPVILVVRADRTRREHLASTCAALRAADRPPLGVILNRATTRKRNNRWRITRPWE